MAKLSVPYLIRKENPAGLPRWYWQPSFSLRKLGFRPARVPANWAAFDDADALQVAAIGAAKELNRQMADAMAQRGAPSRPEPVRLPAGRTVRELVHLYEQSARYGRLASKTKSGYQQCLARILDWAGDMPVRAIDAPRVQRLHAAMAATPAYANAVVRVLRLLLEHGRREGWLTVNPALRPGLTGADPSGILWPREAVQAFVAEADASGHQGLGTAILLNEWLGQRQNDIRTLARATYRNGSLVFRQSKTGAGVSLPLGDIPHLKARLEAEIARSSQVVPPVLTIIVNEETGLPYGEDCFRHHFAEVRAKVAARIAFFDVDYLLPGRCSNDPDAFRLMTLDLTFQHLRHTAVTRLAEAGCDTTLISAVSGHSQETVAAIMKRYMVRTDSMARLAFQKRQAAETK